ncbi:MAG: PhzF family phenazine biosynthesis protein [Clostridia bacterium]|nr:PhzF family phenazine biosynthesis protein [Clostridia bacterium]
MKIYQVDAFAEKPFSGNPAAVCILESYPNEKWMKDIASEMNLAETAFVVPTEDGFSLRWFTPTSEVDLCGHATLASAHILWEEGYIIESQTANFYTKSGLLTAKNVNGWIQHDLPPLPEHEVEAPKGLIEALNIKPVYVGKNVFDYLIEVESEEMVKNMNPDFTKLLKIPMRGVIVTARSKEYDFISRFFAPEVGVFEDPVTGSAHCSLALYWQKKLEKDSFTAYQASKRGGILKVQIEGERILVSGKAITVLKGSLLD